VQGGTLAALSTVLIRHPDSGVWRQKAKHLQFYGQQIEQASQGRDRKAYLAVKRLVEQCTDILNGSLPQDDPQSGEDASFAAIADRPPLMKRMQTGFDWLKQEITSESALKKHSERIEHEAAVIAVLTQVIADESYEYSDDEPYAQMAAGLIEDSVDMSSALVTQNYDAFGEALNRAGKRCVDCHTDYR
jgi:cytochrome c556